MHIEVTNTCVIALKIDQLNKVERLAFPFLRLSSFNPVTICLAPVHREETIGLNMHEIYDH